MLECLEICYEDLKDDEQKACFLYGALYPKESEIYVDYLSVGKLKVLLIMQKISNWRVMEGIWF